MTKVTITDIKLAEKRVTRAALWYFVKGLIVGAITTYVLI
jgi:hypothetical protein